ncbi:MULTISPECIES: N-acetylmuramic acid 6-phosphate etherase [unclassified Sphingomonas]|uniref:N-acetylmuramic acid 6-phosphate etherase n=1 Tax=unclassified Sphingomonas TaxID=196159 RepID=UPI000925BDDE|nr:MULTISPECIES: N-acetylmuramic acid 6-phosphate etherase [unclassified Sphingomonas]OJU16176.1 MAG: N-acetylmuramic acid 6-phosphate etherase [Sphingomonas sp. 66-10]
MNTEIIDPRYIDLASWPTEIAVEAMLEGQLAAVAAIKAQIPAIAGAADAAAERLGETGRLVYVGAGTSGRVAVQDGVELYPTYSWPRERVLFLMAGGLAALTESAEGAEDDEAAARHAVAEARIGASDVVIGVAASGRTPYTVAAIVAARTAGALTVGLANNPDSPLAGAAEHGITVRTGAEIVAGSTRMKAGTAQKAVLNMLSTATMLRLGRVHRGLMVNMRVSNEKLLHRGREMVRDIAGVDMAAAADALDAAGREIKPAVLIALGATEAQARQALAQAGGDLSRAITAWRAADA